MIAWWLSKKRFQESESRAEARHRELVAFNEVISELEFIPTGSGSAYAELPAGTLPVKSKKGRLHLEPPLSVSASFSGGLVGTLGPADPNRDSHGE